MGKVFVAFLSSLVFAIAAQATTFNVATNGNDANPGTKAAPFRTIQHAADLAQPGDVITVHAGIYRERVSPPRGGTSDAKRIVYQAAPGEKVVITGSEEVKNWVKVQGDVWKTTLPNSFFGGFNPYSDLIHGDWFSPHGRQASHRSGLSRWQLARRGRQSRRCDEADGKRGALVRRRSTQKTPRSGRSSRASTRIGNTWRSTSGRRCSIRRRRASTTLRFAASRLEDAATPWAPPTAEQIGVIGPHWSKGWIIENNVIRNSICSGISLGKYGDQWDNTSANSAEGYVKTIQRALANGWSKEKIGHHIVRNNTISDCGQTGIVGSLGAAFSTVTGNTIHDIHVRRLFSGAEIAGIKFHGAIDVQIVHNHIYRTPLGLWLDWMAQGTRVSRNLFHDNDSDVFVEVDHGPFLFDNNLFLSPVSLSR